MAQVFLNAASPIPPSVTATAAGAAVDVTASALGVSVLGASDWLQAASRTQREMEIKKFRVCMSSLIEMGIGTATKPSCYATAKHPSTVFYPALPCGKSDKRSHMIGSPAIRQNRRSRKASLLCITGLNRNTLRCNNANPCIVVVDMHDNVETIACSSTGYGPGHLPPE